jgi:hypothetical protein
MKCESQVFFFWPKAYIERNKKVQKTNVHKDLEKRKTQSLDSRGLERQTKVLKCKGLVEFH